jgi:hypothetical protein
VCANGKEGEDSRDVVLPERKRRIDAESPAAAQCELAEAAESMTPSLVTYRRRGCQAVKQIVGDTSSCARRCVCFSINSHRC